MDGTLLTVVASSLCEDVGIDRVEDTAIYEVTNSTPQRSRRTLYAAAGLGALGGLFMLVPSASESDSSTPTMTGAADEPSIPPPAAYAIGGGLLTFGVGTAIPVIRDAIRIRRGIRERTERQSETAVVAHDVACNERVPGANRQLVARNGSSSAPIGTTDGDGRLEIDLVAQIPRSWLTGSNPPATLAIESDSVLVDLIDTEAIRVVHEANAFAALNLQGCASGTTTAACTHLRSFMSEYPRAARRADVGAILRDVDARIAAAQREIEARRIAEIERQRQFLLAQQQAETAARLARDAAIQQEYEREVLRQQEAARRAQADSEARQRRSQCSARCRASCHSDSGCTSQCIQATCS